MTRRLGLKIATAVLMCGATIATADASQMFKGGGIITNRSPASGACDAAFDIGDAFVMEYRPNFSTTPSTGFNETMTLFTAETAILVTSTDTANRKLFSAGTVQINTFAFGRNMPAQVNVPIAGSTFQVLPSPTITTSTQFIGVIATAVPNFGGVPGCSVSFSAGLAKYIAPTPF